MLEFLHLTTILWFWKRILLILRRYVKRYA